MASLILKSLFFGSHFPTNQIDLSELHRKVVFRFSQREVMMKENIMKDLEFVTRTS